MSSSGMPCEDLFHLGDDTGGSLVLDLHYLRVLAIVINHQEIVFALICEDICSHLLPCQLRYEMWFQWLLGL